MWLHTYSGTPLIRTPWNEDTLINRTLFAVPNAMFVYNFNPWNQDTSLIRTLSSIPRVSGFERFHCTPCRDYTYTCMLHISRRPCCHSTANSRALPLSPYTCDPAAFCEKERKIPLEACTKKLYDWYRYAYRSTISPAVTAVKVMRMDHLELVHQVFPVDWHTEKWEWDHTWIGILRNGNETTQLNMYSPTRGS